MLSIVPAGRVAGTVDLWKLLRVRIGIDALSLKPGHSGGGETYVVNLLRALQAQAQEHELVVYSSPGLVDRVGLSPVHS